MKKGIITVLALSISFCNGLNLLAQNPVKGRSTEDGRVVSNTGLKMRVAIGRFSNETTYGKGLFYDKENDPMGKQALDILSTKLAESGKFVLLERSDMDKVLSELKQDGERKEIKQIPADYLIIGSITEFGRKVTGKTGVFSAEKTQQVEAAVGIRIVNVETGMVIYSDQAKGVSQETAKTTLGLGGKAGYDATLSDKAISVAVDKLVENILIKLKDNPWRAYFLDVSPDAILITGGASQGVKPGLILKVKEQGREVKNRQTGAMMRLPGKQVAEVEVISVQGGLESEEYAIVRVISGEINANNIDKYYLTDTK